MRSIRQCGLLIALAAGACGTSKPECFFDDCPQPSDGTVARCVDGKCTTACETAFTLSDMACIGGVTRACARLLDAPCDQCVVDCGTGRFCGAGGTCQPLQQPGTACLADTTCDSGRCMDGPSGKICSMPLGWPCAAGDPCPKCIQGFCTEECTATFGSEFCWSGVCSEGLLPPPASGATGHCHRRCDIDPMACMPGQSCILPPDFFATSSVRICAWGTAASGI